jgi:hypothetical protein
MCTRVTTLVVCGRTSTVDNDVTVPVVMTWTGTSRVCARTVLTPTDGAEAARAGAEPPGAAAPVAVPGAGGPPQPSMAAPSAQAQDSVKGRERSVR